MTYLLDDPHHDGSPLYAPPGAALGERVPVRVRVPVGNPERAVWLRTVRDGEPRLEEARLDRVTADERWYVADVLVHNPLTSYRFLLDEPGGYRWLNGRGVHRRDVPDAADFRLSAHDPAPAWLDSAVVYQVFPDRFARSTGHDGAPAGPLPPCPGAPAGPLPPRPGLPPEPPLPLLSSVLLHPTKRKTARPATPTEENAERERRIGDLRGFGRD